MTPYDLFWIIPCYLIVGCLITKLALKIGTFHLDTHDEMPVMMGVTMWWMFFIVWGYQLSEKCLRSLLMRKDN